MSISLGRRWSVVGQDALEQSIMNTFARCGGDTQLLLLDNSGGETADFMRRM